MNLQKVTFHCSSTRVTSLPRGPSKWDENYQPSSSRNCRGQTMFRPDRTAGGSRRSQWAAKKLAAVVAALVLAGILSAHSETDAAGITSNSSKFAGAFVNWGPYGREHTLQIWEKWLNQAPSSVLGVDFYAQSTWEDFSGLSWVPGMWQKLNPARNVVWSVPLTGKRTSLPNLPHALPPPEFPPPPPPLPNPPPPTPLLL